MTEAENDPENGPFEAEDDVWQPEPARNRSEGGLREGESSEDESSSGDEPAASKKPRRGRRHWAVVSLSLVVVVAATVTAETRMQTSGTSGAAAAATPTATGGTARGRELQFGLDYTDTLPFESTSQLDRSLDDAVAVGAQWIRVDFGWEDYQPFAASPPDFSKFDKVIGAADARGLKILATLGYPPKWARSSKCGSTAACPPASNTAFAQFAAKAATRYAPKGLHTWEIWNEPNIAAWAPAPDPAAYGRLLTVTSTALRAADPQAYIMLGGLAAARPGAGQAYITPYDFITEVGRRGGLKSVDAVAYHPYPTGSVISQSAPFEAISSAPKNIVEALSEQGEGTLPVWITETGANIPELTAKKPDQAVVRAQTLTQSTVAADLIPALDPNVHVATMFWFSDKDGPTFNLHFGLRGTDGTARASLTSLQKAIAAYKKKFAKAK